VTIDQDGNVLDEVEPPPLAAEPMSYHEAIFGDAG
jgi:hypothetical protein